MRNFSSTLPVLLSFSVTLRTLGTLVLHSLIPSSPTTSVFDQLQYESSEQGWPGRSRHLVTGDTLRLYPLKMWRVLSSSRFGTSHGMLIQVLVWTDQCTVSLVHICSVYLIPWMMAVPGFIFVSHCMWRALLSPLCHIYTLKVKTDQIVEPVKAWGQG